MTENIQNSKRIAKNTMMLYIRTVVTILVTLYTSRVVLNTLGATNYGIYDIVGGVVVLFSFINMAMTSATQRFLNFEIGRGDLAEVKRVFSMSMTAHISIALLVLVLAESIGLWFVNAKLNIPADRMVAANWVYQFSILTLCLNIIRVPYHATIIAHERMNFYAYISIVESVLKLTVVYLLLVINQDKLISYSILVFTVILVITICYIIYCNHKFQISRYQPFWDAALYKKLMCFSGWSLLGGAANVSANQGVNILINIFYGVTVNAAMGITNQVMAAVSAFIGNFQTAFNPQLVKSYATGDYDYFKRLIMQTSRISFFLIFIIALPFIICAEPILTLWLKNVPEYTVQFTRLILLFLVIDALSGPLWYSVQAVGKIRNYQILMTFLIALNIPITYLLFYCGFSPEWALITKVIINFITHTVRIFYLKYLIGLDVMEYMKQVMLRCILVILLSAPLPIYIFLNTTGYLGMVITILVSVIITATLIYIIGLRKTERDWINSTIKTKAFKCRT